mgnify:CR=1 FL=1
MSYSFFYWIHIVSYIVWLLAFAGSLFYGYRVWSEKDAVEKRKFMRLERLITSIGGHLGALGILVSGWAMTSISGGPQWGWFSVQLYPWLAIKQLLFIVILVLIVFSIRRSRIFKKRLKQEEGNAMGTDTSDKWRRAYWMSLSIYILVVINTLLGLTRPLLAF